MNKIIFKPSGISIPSEKDKSILNVALENEVDIEHYCGGMSACNTCRIFIRKGLEAFNSKNKDEKYQLELIGINDDSARLSCCAMIEKDFEGDIEIFIPGNTIINEEDW